jgi:hypothetical protein
MHANGLPHDIQAPYEWCLYFEDELIMLGGNDTLEAEPSMKLLARRKSAQRFALDDGPIWQAAPGK